MQETYSLNETCSLSNACAGRENFNNTSWVERAGTRPPEFKPIEAEGVNGCAFCRRPYRENMNQCPECGRFYFGPLTKNGFPKVFKTMQLECEACE